MHNGDCTHGVGVHQGYGVHHGYGVNHERMLSACKKKEGGKERNDDNGGKKIAICRPVASPPVKIIPYFELNYTLRRISFQRLW